MPDSEAGDEPDQGVGIGRWEIVGRESNPGLCESSPKPLGFWTDNGLLDHQHNGEGDVGACCT